MEPDPVVWYCADPWSDLLHVNEEQGNLSLGALGLEMQKKVRELIERLEGTSMDHLHIMCQKVDVKKEEMTRARFERIIFLIYLGLREGTWPPMEEL